MTELSQHFYINLIYQRLTINEDAITVENHEIYSC
jgi:hypothetical protein